MRIGIEADASWLISRVLLSKIVRSNQANCDWLEGEPRDLQLKIVLFFFWHWIFIIDLAVKLAAFLDFSAFELVLGIVFAGGIYFNAKSISEFGCHDALQANHILNFLSSFSLSVSNHQIIDFLFVLILLPLSLPTRYSAFVSFRLHVAIKFAAFRKGSFFRFFDFQCYCAIFQLDTL